MTDRGFALHHILTAHEDFGAVRVFMTIKEFSRNNTTEFFDFVDIAINCLLENFVYHFEVTGKIGTFQAAGQVDKYIKV